MIGKSAKDILIRIKGDDKAFRASLKSSNKSLKDFRKNVQDNYGELLMWGGAAGAGAAAIAIHVSKTGMQFEQLDRGFNNLAASQGKNADEYLKRIKDVSHGTVSEVEIMRKANQAMLLGLDLDTIEKMMEGAAVIAQATGQDVGYMFESLAMGVGRESRMLLDNLGIIVKVEEANQAYADRLGITVSELSDADKKAAFLNATMEGLNERTEALGGYTEDTATQIAVLKTNMDDAAASAGTKLLPALDGVVGGLNMIIEASGGAGAAGALAEMVTAPIEVAGLFGKQLATIITIQKLKKHGIDTEQELVSLLRLQSNQLNDMTDAEFERKIYLMEGYGFAEKAAKLENARVWGLRHMLDVEKEITKESEKQLTLEERKAAFLASPLSAKQRSIRESISLGTAGLGVEGETRKSGQWTIGPSVASIRSGV